MQRKTKKILLGLFTGVAGVGAIAGVSYAIHSSLTTHNSLSRTSTSSIPSISSNGTLSNSNYVAHNASGSMYLTLNALNNNTLSPNDNEVTAVVNSGDNVKLTADLSLLSDVSSSTNTTATYQWYYVTTLPSDLDSKITSQVANSTQVQNATLSSLSLTSSQLATLAAKTGIIAYYCEATITSTLGSTTTYSGWYVLNTSSIISSSYTINSENEQSTSTNVAFTQNESVSLGLTLSSNSAYSDISQSWYQSDSDSSDASFSAISGATSHILSVNNSLVSANKLNYFYNKITYTYNGAEFVETSDIFAVSNIQTTFTINSNAITSSNGYNYDLANSNTDNVTLGGDISNSSASDVSYQWYQDLKTGISNATAISNATSNTYEIKGNGGTSLIEADYYEKITYTIDGITFSVYSSPFYVTNIGFSNPGITINSSSSSSTSSSSSSTSSNSDSGTTKSTSKSSSDSSSTSSSTSATLPSFSQNNAVINTFVDTEVSKAFSVTTSDSTSAYTVSYAWYQGTTLLANETSSSYTPTILSTANDDSTVNYKLVITLINKTTNTTQTINKSFTLNIIALPTFTQTNNNINAISGITNTEVFGVSTSNNSSNYKISYAWYEGTNSTAIANATTASYTPTTPSTTSKSVLNYKVVITVTDETLGISTTMTKDFTLTVIPSATVSIATGNVSQIAYINGSYGNNDKAFSPTITLNDPTDYTLSYQWYSSSSASTTNGTKIDGATEATYTPSTSANNGYYYLVVTASYDGKAVNTFTSGSYAYYDLSYSINQARKYSWYHADYKITCSISTNDSSIDIESYSWKFDGGTSSGDIKNGTTNSTMVVTVDGESDHSVSCEITIKINSISYEVSVPNTSLDTTI